MLFVARLIGSAFMLLALFLISPWFDPARLPAQMNERSWALLEFFGRAAFTPLSLPSSSLSYYIRAIQL